MSTSASYSNLQPPYYIDLNQGQQQFYDPPVLHHHTTPISFFSLQPYSSSSSSSLSSPVYLNPAQDQQAGYFYMGPQLQPSQYHQEVDNFSSYRSGSYDQTAIETNKRTNNTLKFSICKKEDKSFSGGDESGSSACASEINHSSVKWMSSKMRLMKKMMKIEENQKRHPPPVQVEADTGLICRSTNNNNSSNTNNDNTIIRVCSDCNTTKTPLWRSGPRGPKSLCNACGIRQRKARRAMAAAMLPNSLSGSMMRVGNSHKKAPNNNGFGAQKRRSKVAKPPRDHHRNAFQRKLCFEEFALNLNRKLSLHQVFPQEEKEAAILLMALSCGLVHG